MAFKYGEIYCVQLQTGMTIGTRRNDPGLLISLFSWNHLKPQNPLNEGSLFSMKNNFRRSLVMSVITSGCVDIRMPCMY